MVQSVGPENQLVKKSKNIYEQLLCIVDNPVTRCANCVCQYCANNAEELWNKVRPEEVKEPCFNCDECHEFTGDCKHRAETKKHCAGFLISNYGAARNRKRMKVIEDGGKRV